MGLANQASSLPGVQQILLDLTKAVHIGMSGNSFLGSSATLFTLLDEEVVVGPSQVRVDNDDVSIVLLAVTEEDTGSFVVRIVCYAFDGSGEVEFGAVLLCDTLDGGWNLVETTLGVPL